MCTWSWAQCRRPRPRPCWRNSDAQVSGTAAVPAVRCPLSPPGPSGRNPQCARHGQRHGSPSRLVGAYPYPRMPVLISWASCFQGGFPLGISNPPVPGPLPRSIRRPPPACRTAASRAPWLSWTVSRGRAGTSRTTSLPVRPPPRRSGRAGRCRPAARPRRRTTAGNAVPAILSSISRAAAGSRRAVRRAGRWAIRSRWCSVHSSTYATGSRPR